MKGVPLTFSRASVAYNNGVSVPANIPRFQTVDGKRGILIEEGTTNIISSFASLPPNSSMIMSSSDAGTFSYSYEDISSSERLQVKSATLTATYAGLRTYAIYNSLVGITANQPYTATIWSGYLGNASNCYISIDWYDSTSTYISSSAFYLTSAGLKKYVVTGIAPTNATKALIKLKGQLNLGDKLVWNAAQLENKAYPTSFTLGGTTRQPETLYLPVNLLNSEKFTLEFELYVNDAFKNTYNNKYSYICLADDGTTNNIFSIQHSPSGAVRPAITSGGLRYPTGIPDVNLTNGWHKFRVGCDSSILVITMDGDLVNQSSISNPTLITAPLTRLAIGSNTAGYYQLNTVIRNVCLSKIKRADTETQLREQLNIYPIDSKVTGFALLENDIRGVASV